jgi:hypothetical protein
MHFYAKVDAIDVLLSLKGFERFLLFYVPCVIV